MKKANFLYKTILSIPINMLIIKTFEPEEYINSLVDRLKSYQNRYLVGDQNDIRKYSYTFFFISYNSNKHSRNY